MIALLPAVLLLVQAVISVHTELVAVPLVVSDGGDASRRNVAEDRKP